MMREKKKKKTFLQNKSVESTDNETGLRDISIENNDESSKAASVNSKMFGSRSFCGSCMIPVTTLCTFLYCDLCRRQAWIFRLY
jgi:hypothetical protein